MRIEAKNVQAVFNALRSQRIVPNAGKIREKGKGLEMEIKIPGLAPRPEPEATEERGADEPPRDDPRGPIDPHKVDLRLIAVQVQK